MVLLEHSAPIALALGGWLVMLPFVWIAVQRVRAFGILPQESAAQHGLLAGVVIIAVIWTLQIPSPLGIKFGLIGSALFAVVFGYSRALLGLIAAITVHTLIVGGSWLNFGINTLLLAVLPVTLAVTLQQAVARLLPHNIFVFIFGNGLFVTLVVTALAGVLLVTTAAVTLGTGLRMATDHFVGVLLLAWGEALMSGVIFTSLVIFLPRMVLTYDQDVYLPPQQR
jgi:uncharacterized membrane protein